MRNFRTQFILLLSSMAVIAGCSRPASISAEITDALESDIVLIQQNVRKFDVLDTVKTDASGKFTYRVKLQKGDPDFVYLYRNGVKLASLLLQQGERVQLTADTLGHYSVSGSAESEKLAQVEDDYTTFIDYMTRLAEAIEIEEDNSPKAASLRAEMGKEYTQYYRKCVKYVMENSKSLTVVPVFFQTMGESFYIFSQDTDALHFQNAADSLETVYPDSRYVKALRHEADSRAKQLELRVRMQTAEEVGYINLELPDTKGNKVKISDLEAKAILVCFWSPDNALQKMSNLDMLKKIYEDYHDRGLEIYQVAISSDKPAWERIVNAQGLSWVNVCDGLGQNSPALASYNVSRLPTYFLIDRDRLSDRVISNEQTLRAAIREAL